MMMRSHTFISELSLITCANIMLPIFFFALFDPVCRRRHKQVSNTCVFQFASSLPWNQWVGPGRQDPRRVGDTRSEYSPKVKAVGVPPVTGSLISLLWHSRWIYIFLYVLRKPKRLMVFSCCLAGLERYISTSPRKKEAVSRGWSLTARLQLCHSSIRCSPTTPMNASRQKRLCGTHTLGKPGTSCQ